MPEGNLWDQGNRPMIGAVNKLSNSTDRLYQATSGAADGVAQLSRGLEGMPVTKGGIWGDLSKLGPLLVQTGAIKSGTETTTHLIDAAAGSSAGDNAGIMASSVASDMMTWAMPGFLTLNPALAAAGALLGAVVGFIDGATEIFEKRDDAFKDHIKGQMEGFYQGLGERLETGTMLAAAEDGIFRERLAEAQQGEDRMERSMGMGYTSARYSGLTEQERYYSGDGGKALQEMNSIIGSGRAYQDNLEEKYQREALSAMLEGKETSLYEGDQAARLQEMNEEYRRLVDEFRTASEDEKAGIAAQIERLQGEAEGMAESAFNASVGMTEVRDAQLGLIEALRDNTYALGERAWNFDYLLQEEESKGIGYANKGHSDGEPGYTSDAPGATRRGQGDRPGLAFGLNRVPYDNFPALLHEGERVLTASQARAADRENVSINIAKIADTVVIREEADLYKLAEKIVERARVAALLAVPR